jgi:hypothetical protein
MTHLRVPTFLPIPTFVGLAAPPGFCDAGFHREADGECHPGGYSFDGACPPDTHLGQESSADEPSNKICYPDATSCPEGKSLCKGRCFTCPPHSLIDDQCLCSCDVAKGYALGPDGSSCVHKDAPPTAPPKDPTVVSPCQTGQTPWTDPKGNALCITCLPGESVDPTNGTCIPEKAGAGKWILGLGIIAVAGAMFYGATHIKKEPVLAFR